jgi:hypothetical protein
MLSAGLSAIRAMAFEVDKLPQNEENCIKLTKETLLAI